MMESTKILILVILGSIGGFLIGVGINAKSPESFKKRIKVVTVMEKTRKINATVEEKPKEAQGRFEPFLLLRVSAYRVVIPVPVTIPEYKFFSKLDGKLRVLIASIERRDERQGN
jgi:hypothetical protein